MTSPTLEAKAHDVLAQKGITAAGVSRNHSHHPVGNLIYQRLKNIGHDVFGVGVAVVAPAITCEGRSCFKG